MKQRKNWAKVKFLTYLIPSFSSISKFTIKTVSSWISSSKNIEINLIKNDPDKP